MSTLTLTNVSINVAEKQLVSGLTAELSLGEVWGILGPNGSGKSTLLQTLMNIQQPTIVTSGNIQLQNKTISSYSRLARAQQMGILFQDFPAADFHTVFDYCKGGRYPHAGYLQAMKNSDRIIVEQALKTMELWDQSQQIVKHLSGGEKQRLALATLLAQDPHIFLLDEPSNHLDLRHQIETLRYFKSLAHQQKKLVVMTLHDINLAQQFCDHIILLQGDITHVGPKNLMMTAEKLSHLYEYPVRYSSRENFWHPIILGLSS